MKKILVVGRYLKHPIYNLREYDHICFVNCENKHPRSSRFMCVCANSLYEERIKRRGHDGCILYNPHNIFIRTRPQDKQIPQYYLDAIKFSCPDYHASNVGWCSTGLMALFYFLYSEKYEVDVLGFSHFSILNGVVMPEEGMQDAYDGSVGRHSSDLEFQLAQFLLNNYSTRMNIHRSNFKGVTPLKHFIDNCAAAVFIIGDSHNRIFKHMPIRKYLKIRSATTMFRVYRDGIDALLNPKHERAIPLEKDEIPRQGDVCFFSFGYVDVINNILRHRTPVQEIVHKYVKAIKEYAHKRLVYPIIQVDLIQQPADLSHKHTGSLQERIKIQKQMHHHLKSSCIDNKISMFEYTSEYENPDGTFNTVKALSEDNAHIGHNSTNAVSCTGCEKCAGENARKIWEKFYQIEINMR